MGPWACRLINGGAGLLPLMVGSLALGRQIRGRGQPRQFVEVLAKGRVAAMLAAMMDHMGPVWLVLVLR